jgi:hypothetical protein
VNTQEKIIKNRLDLLNLATTLGNVSQACKVMGVSRDTFEAIDHTRSKAKFPQINRICEHFRRTILEEFYQVAFRKKVFQRLEFLQPDVDE